MIYYNNYPHYVMQLKEMDSMEIQPCSKQSFPSPNNYIVFALINFPHKSYNTLYSHEGAYVCIQKHNPFVVLLRKNSNIKFYHSNIRDTQLLL